MTKTKKTCLWCSNPALKDKEHCGAKRCKSNYNAREHRRRSGTKSLAEALADVGTRNCKHCGAEFTPAGLKSEYCTVECRKAEANRVRREKAATAPKDRREQCIEALDAATIVGEQRDSTPLLPWITKEEFFSTDNRHKKTKNIVDEAKRFRKEEGEMSLRFLFYHLVSQGFLQNTKNQYSRLTDYITEARDRGNIEPDAFEDTLRESKTYSFDESLNAFKQSVPRWFPNAYKRDMWQRQNKLIEVWTEKDSIVSVVEPMTEAYKVPLRILRGQGSTPYVFGIAKELQYVKKPIHIFYLGDHDPAGYAIEDSARQRSYKFLLEELDWSPEDIRQRIRWKRIGFLQEDFEKFNLQSIEDDKVAGLEVFVARFHSEVEQWNGGSKEEKKAWAKRIKTQINKAELEALPPAEIRARVTFNIKNALGEDGVHLYREDEETEKDERQELGERIADALSD